MLNDNRHDIITGRWLPSNAPDQTGLVKPPPTPCSLCEKPSETKGMCAIHYRALLRIAKGIKPHDPNASCHVCGGEHVALGLCQKHYNQEQNQRPEVRFRHFIHSAKKNSRSVSLTIDQYLFLINKPCHYCGEAGSVINGSGLDRVDSMGHYDIWNVVPCCWKCNFMKRDLSVSEWLFHLQKVLANCSRHHSAMSELNWAWEQAQAQL